MIKKTKKKPPDKLVGWAQVNVLAPAQPENKSNKVALKFRTILFQVGTTSMSDHVHLFIRLSIRSAVHTSQ